MLAIKLSCSCFILLILLGMRATFLQAFGRNNATSLQTKNKGVNSTICNHSYLSAHYRNATGLQNKSLMLKNINEGCTKYFPSCLNNKTSDLSLTMVLSIDFEERSDIKKLKVNLTVGEIRKDCMTYYVEGTWYTSGVPKKYSSFSKVHKRCTFYPDYNSTYHFILIELPSNNSRSMLYTLPSKCETHVFIYIDKVLSEINKTHICPFLKSTDLDREILHESKNLCLRKQSNIDEAERLFVRRVRTLCYLKRPPVIVINDQKSIMAAILSVSIATLICLVVVYFVKSKKNCSKCFNNKPDSFMSERERISIVRSVSDDSNSSYRTEPPTVMILNRPGCELLDTLLRDIAFILQSYGIQVRLSLLEQSELDAEGGISSYLQRNIDACDYILVMFTEYLEEQPLTQHKPYEFALNVISGLMFHTNDSSRYLALYTSSFEEAMHYMPTVFHASQNYGYRIPKDVPELVEKLLGTKIDKQQQKERDLKNKLFLNRMKYSKKKLDGKVHEKCQRTRCHKGTAFPSVSNLSSLWATTVHSGKWPSFNSIGPNCRESVIQTENGDEFLHVELWRHNNTAISTVTDDANQNRVVAL